jgi:hypothetical protein
VDITVRSDKGTRIALGCAAAFLGLFFLAGVFVIAVVLAGDAPDKVPGLLAGLVFAVVPGLGLLLVYWMWKQAAQREARRLRAPDQPWAWDQEIKGREVSGTSPTATVAVWAIFAGIWLGFMALVTALGWDKVRSEPGLALFMAVFWLVGLFLGGMAVRAILHARRFGRSTLALDQVPARLGGWLSGVVHGPQAVHGGELQVTVECLQTTHTRSSSGSSRSTWTMWRTTKILDGERCLPQAKGTDIPFAVRLPTNEEVSRERNDNVLSSMLGERAIDLVGSDMDWYVDVKARLRGVDYSDRFQVPVAAPEPGAPRASAVPPREMPELAGDRLAQRLPGRLEYGTDADVFVFPVKPSWIVWNLIFLAAGGLCAAQYLLGGVPLAEKLGETPLIWTGLITGGIGILCFVGLMLDTRRIEVAPQAVRVRRGILGIGFHRTIPRTEIAAVEEEASRSDPPTYSVNIKTHDGTSYWAALALREADQAAALAMRLRDVLQLAVKS